MKKIVFSSVLVFSILNAKTLTTKDDFLQWSATPSNISSKITELGANTLDYWKKAEFEISESIFSTFENAVANNQIQTAKDNIQKVYDDIKEYENKPENSHHKSNYDNLKRVLIKNGLDKHNGLDFNDMPYSKWYTFFDATLDSKIDEQISTKETSQQRTIQELGVDTALISKIMQLKAMSDDIINMGLSEETKKAIKGVAKGNSLTNDLGNNLKNINETDLNKLVNYFLNLVVADDKRLTYIRDNTENETFLAVLLDPNGIDELIKKAEKENYDNIQKALNSKELEDIVELQTIKGILADFSFDTYIYHIKQIEDKADADKLKIQTAETARETLEQAIKDTAKFKELLYLVKIDSVLSQHLPNADNDTSGAELFTELAKLDTSRDFKDQDPQIRQKVQTKADTFATKVLESKKSEVMTNVTAPTLVQLNNMTKRLGELRDLNARYGAWLRSYGGQMSADSKHINYYSIQLGADKVNRLKNDKLIIGFLAGFDKINGYIDSQTYSVGGYVSYLHSSGVFSDMVAKYTHTKHEKSGHEFDKQHSFLASFESGYRFGFGYEFYVEQSLEFITGYIGKYQDKVGTSSISIDAYTPFIIKPQAHIGGMVGGFSYRLGVGGVLNVAEQEAKISLNMDEISKGLKADGKTKLDKNNHGFVSLGGAYKVGKKSRISLSAERSFGGKIVNDYEINATIRVGF